MAEVRAGWDIRLDRPVAVKLLLPMLLADQESRARFAFEARSAAALKAALMRAIAEHHLPPLLAQRPDVDPVLADVIDRAMSPDPTQRFADAPSMRAALHAVRPPTRVLDAPLPVGVPMTGAVPPPPPPGKRRWMLGVGAVLLAVLLALVLVVVEAAGSDPATSESPAPSTPSTSATSSVAPVTSATTTSGSAPADEAGPRDNPGKGNKKPKKTKPGN